MKYCLSARQPKEYIEKTDEVIFQWEDRDHIIDLMEINPNLSFVLYIPDSGDMTDDNWSEVKQYYIMTKKKLKVALFDIGNYQRIKNFDIPFFYAIPVQDGYTLNSLINIGVCAARITGELAHNLDYLENLPIEIRVFANNAGNFLGYDPIIGGWFRPEDINDLEAIDVCEFISKTQKEEQALFRIYAENKEWPGELYLLVKDIKDEEITNRMIPPEFQIRRSNCKMRCMSGSHCHYCRAVTDLAKPSVLRPLKEQLEKDNNNDRII